MTKLDAYVRLPITRLCNKFVQVIKEEPLEEAKCKREKKLD